MFKYSLISTVVFLSSLALAANELGEYRFKHLSEADGLLHANVTAIEADSAGFMWFGTHRGLNRFDGYTIDSWRHTSNGELDVYYNRIYSLGAVGHNLWMGTGAGLACFDMAANRYADFEFSPTADGDEFSRHIEYVLPDNRPGCLWVRASNILKLYEITPDTAPLKIDAIRIGSSNAYKAGEPSPKVAFDDNGHVWFSGCEHLECYNREPAGNLSYSGQAANVTGNNVKALIYDDNSLWIAYHTSVAHYAVHPDGTLRFISRIDIPTTVGVNSMSVGKDYVWIGAQDGVFRLNKHDSSEMRAMCPLSDVNCIKIDKFNNIWVSGWDSGVAFAGNKADFFGTLRFPAASPNRAEFISSLHYDPDGYIYVGSKFGGLGRINAATKQTEWNFCVDPSVRGAHITAISSDASNIYAAVDNYIAAINKTTHKISGIIRSKNHGYIFGLAFDRFGRMWLATYAGLECLERDASGKWQSRAHFRNDSPQPFSLTTNLLHNIYSDLDKNELIVTSADGLNRVILGNSGQVESILHYRSADAPEGQRLSSDFLWPIDRADAPSTYWVGTMGSGLNKISFIDTNGAHTYRAIHYQTSPENMSDDVESIQTDRFGRVWCAGTGLGYFDESLAKFTRYDLSDGLQGSRFGTSSSTRDSSGTIWFGGVNGLNYFVPERETSAHVLTDVVFSRAAIAGVPVEGFGPSSKEITLKYPDNNLTVSFSTLAYANTAHVSYRYKLEGYDNDWHYLAPGQLPEAVYAKLPYKRMHLIVEAGDRHDWSGTPAVLTVDSHGPWWLSWWAWLIYASLILALIGCMVYYLNERSKRKRAEAVGRERELQQQEIMKMKMRFFTDVSHEFRTPLTLIRHAAGELGNASDPSRQRYVKLISRNAGVLANMVNELLDFHRVDIGSTPLHTTLTSVVGMISSIVEEFSGWAEESGLTISCSSREPEIDMWIDREQVSKILSNIISNSIRYTDAGGCIEVKIESGLYQDVVAAFPSKYCIVSSMIPGRQLIVRVRDTGSGIAAASLSVIFERFRQTDDRSRSTAASGIGLSLVKALTMLHHGGIVVSSEEGVGTEMILFIPMTYDYLAPEQKFGDSNFAVKDYLRSYGAAYQTVDIAPQDPPSAAADASIMVVDDNREILDLLTEFFAGDYEVIAASSAQEALEILGDRLPDLILSDVMMPGLSGLEFCAKLKTDLHTCHIPVVLLTAMANEDSQIEGIEIGADAYIAKPFNPKLLKATVKNLLARVRRDTPTKNPSRAEIKNRKERELFERFETLVKANLTNPDYSVDSIWQELGLNRTRLYAMVKEITGMPLGSYVKKLRLEQAARLLLQTDMTVSEVAYSVGIDNLAYFSRLFKSEYGLSPTEWIKNQTAK